MTRCCLLLALCAAFPARAQPYAAPFTRVLQAVVTDDGSVRYGLLGRAPHRARLDSVLAAIETYDLATLRTDADKMAFWINAYNALMLDAIAGQPGRQNVLGSDDGALFFKTPHTVGGVRVTLDEVENVILRRKSGPAALEKLQVQTLDPRLHVALNCAAVSCPRLRREAFTPARLDALLDAGMRDFAGSPRHFDVQNGEVLVSSLLDWFGADFDARGAAGPWVLGFMRPDRPHYALLRRALAGRDSRALRDAARRGSAPRVRFFYDWTVRRASQER